MAKQLTLAEVRRISKQTGKSFEQIFREHYGREVRKNDGSPEVRSTSNRSRSVAFTDTPEWRTTVAAAQRTLADHAVKQEQRNAEAARNAVEVKNLLFPWEN